MQLSKKYKIHTMKNVSKVKCMADDKKCKNCTFIRFAFSENDHDYDPEAAEEEYQRREILEELGYSRYSEGDFYDTSDDDFEEIITCSNELSPNYQYRVLPNEKCEYWEKQKLSDRIEDCM